MLAAAPYDRLAVTTQQARLAELESDAVSQGAGRLLLVAAAVALGVGLLALVLLVVGERRDDEGELLAHEADGVATSTLRRSLWLRAVGAAVPALVAGAVAGLVLTRAVTSLVELSAGGVAPTPPLLPAVGAGWTTTVLLVGVALALGSLRAGRGTDAALGVAVTPVGGAAMSAAVEVHDLFCLHASPSGSVAALRGMSLLVPERERLVIHGPNGSGKSTLLGVLAGEVAPSSGNVRVAGVDLVGADERVRTALRRDLLGLVDQRTARSLRAELDVTDNVALQLRLGGIRTRAARTQAHDMLDRLGLAHLATRRPETLSGGEAQRVAVAAALAHRPRLVLADEPTGELDRDAADAVYDVLAEAVHDIGATLVLVTHDPRATRIADRVVRIRDGRLSEQWHPREPESVTLVVDDRGWVRLPDRLRHENGALDGVVATATEGGVLLRGTAPAMATAARPGGTERRAGGEVVARLDRVSVRYAGVVVLDELDLEVRAGRLTVVAGTLRAPASRRSCVRSPASPRSMRAR